jgi:hypothetical protein
MRPAHSVHREAGLDKSKTRNDFDTRNHSLTSIRFVSRIAAEVTAIEKEACASSDKLHSEGVPFVARCILDLWGSFSQRSFFA